MCDMAVHCWAGDRRKFKLDFQALWENMGQQIWKDMEQQIWEDMEPQIWEDT